MLYNFSACITLRLFPEARFPVQLLKFNPWRLSLAQPRFLTCKIEITFPFCKKKVCRYVTPFLKFPVCSQIEHHHVGCGGNEKIIMKRRQIIFCKVTWRYITCWNILLEACPDKDKKLWNLIQKCCKVWKWSSVCFSNKKEYKDAAANPVADVFAHLYRLFLLYGWDNKCPILSAKYSVLPYFWHISGASSSYCMTLFTRIL